MGHLLEGHMVVSDWFFVAGKMMRWRVVAVGT